MRVWDLESAEGLAGRGLRVPFRAMPLDAVIPSVPPTTVEDGSLSRLLVRTKEISEVREFLNASSAAGNPDNKVPLAQYSNLIRAAAFFLDVVDGDFSQAQYVNALDGLRAAVEGKTLEIVAGAPASDDDAVDANRFDRIGETA